MIIPTKKKMEKPQTNKSKGTENKGPCLEKTRTEKVDKIEITQEDELEEEVTYWDSITHVNVIFLLRFFYYIIVLFANHIYVLIALLSSEIKVID